MDYSTLTEELIHTEKDLFLFIHDSNPQIRLKVWADAAGKGASRRI